MNLVQGAPVAVAMTTADAKAHLRVTDNNDDTYIDALIAAATTTIEAWLNCALINRTITYKLDQFSKWIVKGSALCGWLDLPYPPLVSVTSVIYRSTDTVNTTWPSTEYEVDVGSRPGRIVLAYGKSWPCPIMQPNAVTITYVAGFGANAASLPAPIVLALKHLVAHLYENREATSLLTLKEIPYGIECLLMPWRCFTRFT